ncbi:MAG: response regulator [Candidatus Obscuribacterales bacterium]|nr:response regulator [Candidatus Obscuribacterales bacterium]
MTDNKKVLLVEDTLTQAIFMQHCLEKLGFSVQLSRSGEKALEYMAKTSEKPALVFTDINMPGMDGYQLIDALRTSYEKALHCFLLLSPAQIEEADKILASTADGIVFKSGKEDKFIEQVENAIRLLEQDKTKEAVFFSQAYLHVVHLQ